MTLLIFKTIGQLLLIAFLIWVIWFMVWLVSELVSVFSIL